MIEKPDCVHYSQVIANVVSIYLKIKMVSFSCDGLWSVSYFKYRSTSKIVMLATEDFPAPVFPRTTTLRFLMTFPTDFVDLVAMYMITLSVKR